ncbi:MAG: HAMP domain-containing histidine kinase [Pseudomonadota bacterium]|nr:HAMP domain-containing histidine kinase [Pseudomonadota bacterium]
MSLRLSLSLRLALLYMALFCTSVLLLGAVQYWVTVRAPLEAVKQRIGSEAAALVSTFQRGGSDALVEALAQRQAGAAARLPYHALLASDGAVIATSLASLPAASRRRWQRLDADSFEQGEQLDHEALLLNVALDGGMHLLVGRDIEDIDEVEEKLLTAVVGVVGSTLLLGLAGGLLMSRVIGRRLAAVTGAARRVMEGDLSGRIPASGSDDEFEQLNATLNNMLARIEQLFESVRRVSDNVAHELRTPLARLRARLEGLRDADTPLGTDALDGVMAETEGLEKTFDAVLRIARIESGRHGGAVARIDLSTLLRDAVELYAPLAEERRQSLLVAIDDGLAVEGDRELLFQASCNLLDNAIKYTPEDGRIHLSARRSGKQVEITVTDNGPGVAEEHRLHIVERFFRAPATAAAPGAGLGLSLVSAVAHRHHSTLRFEDAAPGLTVRWQLPAARA